MRLTQLHEARYASEKGTEILARVFNDVKRIENGAVIDDVARYIAAMRSDHIYNDYTQEEVAELLFQGTPPLKDNPKEMNEWIQMYYDAQTGEDYDMMVNGLVNFIRSGYKL